MKSFNSVCVAPVRSLEVGDLIAKDFLGGVTSGRITGIAYAAYQLTDEQRKYMSENNLEIPEDKYAPLGGNESLLVFGNFQTSFTNVTYADGLWGHMFLWMDVNVAVFPKD